MKRMKNSRTFSAVILAAFSLGLPFAAVQTCDAQTNTNLFPARISLVCITTNTNGNLAYDRVKTVEFIEESATDIGITNFTGLKLVFNRSNSSLEVINRTNLAVLTTPLSFDGGVSLTNSNGTRVELETYVFLGTNTVASGSLSATEKLTYGTSNQLTSFGLRGQLVYSFTNGTNSPTICRGTLLVGSAIARDDQHDDDDDEDDDNGNQGQGKGNQGQGKGNQGKGNNGNQGNGNNGNHGNGNNGNGVGNQNNGNNGNGNGNQGKKKP